MDGNHHMKTAEKGCVSELMHHTYLTLEISSGLYSDVQSIQHRICFPFFMNNELVVQQLISLHFTFFYFIFMLST